MRGAVALGLPHPGRGSATLAGRRGEPGVRGATCAPQGLATCWVSSRRRCGWAEPAGSSREARLLADLSLMPLLPSELRYSRRRGGSQLRGRAAERIQSDPSVRPAAAGPSSSTVALVLTTGSPQTAQCPAGQRWNRSACRKETPLIIAHCPAHRPRHRPSALSGSTLFSRRSISRF